MEKSVRELRYEIKNNGYERLINKPQKVEILSNSKSETILSNVKNPTLLKLGHTPITNEKSLEICILSQLKNFLINWGAVFFLQIINTKSLFINKIKKKSLFFSYNSIDHSNISWNDIFCFYMFCYY